MNYKSILTAGILFAGLGVVIGAFGAHGLKDILTANQRTETFELAVRYQFYHAFALLVTGVLQRIFPAANFKWAGIFFITGIVIFSGSLYLLSLSGSTWLGAITPFGGVAFIAGWVLLLLKVGRF